MKLELYIRGSLLAEVELTPPKKDRYMDFKDNYQLREKYIRLMIKSVKNRYQRAIQNSEWEIVLKAESRVNDLLSFEENFSEMNGLKKVV